MQSYQNPVLLQGMGGMGKSELMSSWVHQVSNQKVARLNYKNIVYINCSNDIETGFLTNSNVLEQLGISDQIEDKDTGKLPIIIATLNKLDHLLLVLDDLPWHEPATTNCNAQLAYFKTLSCQIIATSRSQDYQQFQPINISSLSEDECINLFSKHSKIDFKENDSIIKKIINLAGRHTLTIELLAKTAYRLQYTPAELFRRLQTSNFNIGTKVRYEKDLDSAYEDIDTALGKLFAIAGLTLQQQQILYHLSLMDSQKVSFDLLVNWLGKVHVKDKSILMDLVTSGWLQEATIDCDTNNNCQSQAFKPKQYYLHPVVSHTVITQFCHEYKDETRNDFFQSVIDNLKQHYRQFDTYQLSHQQSYNQEPQYLQLSKAYLSALASYIRKSISLTNQPKFLESLVSDLNFFIIFCHQQNLNTLGLETLQACIAQISACLGDNNIHYATSLNNLASLYENIADYQQALLLYQKAIYIKKNVLGQHHDDYASVLHNLANLYEKTGKYDEALPLFKQVLKIRKSKSGESNLDYATSLNSLAGLYESMDEYELALPLYEQSFAIRKNKLDEGHPDYAMSLNNLATLHNIMGNYENTLPLYEKALSIVKKQLGEHHPFYSKSLNNLAYCYKKMGDYEQALPLFEQSLSIIKEQSGTRNPDYAITSSNLGAIYISLGNFEQAFTLLKDASEIAEQVLGLAHPITKDIKQNYETGKNCFVADRLLRSWLNH